MVEFNYKVFNLIRTYDTGRSATRKSTNGTPNSQVQQPPVPAASASEGAENRAQKENPEVINFELVPGRGRVQVNHVARHIIDFFE